MKQQNASFVGKKLNTFSEGMNEKSESLGREITSN
jgi:hypothetical protein